MMRGKKGARIVALVLAAIMLLGLVMAVVPMVFAASGDIKVTKIDEQSVGNATVYESGGNARIAIELSYSHSDPPVDPPAVATVSQVIVRTGGLVSGASLVDDSPTVTQGSSSNIFVDLTFNTALGDDEDRATLYIYFEGISNPVPATFDVRLTTETEEETEEDLEEEEPVDPNTTLESALALDAVDVYGHPVAAPTGNAGERVRIVLPLINRNVNVWDQQGSLSGITIAPVLSADETKFPFVIEEMDYTRHLPNMAPGAKHEVVYDMLLSPDTTSGVKQVDFSATYYNAAKLKYETATLSVFISVIEGAEDDEDGLVDEDGNLITSTPKLIVESYSASPLAVTTDDGTAEGMVAQDETADDGKIYAAEPFTLAFTLRNTSADERIDNIQITLENLEGLILPVQGGSSSIYVDTIGAGDSVDLTLDLQTSPDIAAKAHTIVATFNYEGGETKKAYSATENLSIVISQRMRIRVDEPSIYETMVMPEQSVGVYFALYNMGKSSIYNCMVDVEGEGLRMEESYFGGNVSAGNTMRADFTIIPSVPGEIEGNILITYEDSYGAVTEVRKPFTLSVMEDMYGGDMMGDGMDIVYPEDEYYDPYMDAMGEGDMGGGFPWWGYVIVGVVALVVLIVVLNKVRAARRRRELEEI